jgi:hypothetical protein
MGFDVRFVRPDWMIITNMPVPPPPVGVAARGPPLSRPAFSLASLLCFLASVLL